MIKQLTNNISKMLTLSFFFHFSKIKVFLLLCFQVFLRNPVRLSRPVSGQGAAASENPDSTVEGGIERGRAGQHRLVRLLQPLVRRRQLVQRQLQRR